MMLGTLGREGQDSWAGKAYGILAGGLSQKTRAVQGVQGEKPQLEEGCRVHREGAGGWGAMFLLEDKAGVLDAGLGAKHEGRKRQSQNPRRRCLMAFGGSWKDWGTGCQGLEDLFES